MRPQPGGPAFPIQIGPHDVHTGMMLRDYFAVRAPEDIPTWFTHVEPEKTFPPMPDYRKLDEVHQELARQWQGDPVFDLPEELAWYGEQVKAHRMGRMAWNDERAKARFVQWRYAYADLMIAERQAGGA